MAKAKPQYRLQVVLDKREREKDAANRELNARKKQVEFEHKKLEKLVEMRQELEDRKKALVEEFQKKMEEPGTQVGETALAHERYQEVLAKQSIEHEKAIAAQSAQLRRAQERVKEGEKLLLQAMINVQAMEKHKAGWEHEQKLEELRKEQEVQEELGEAMWLQNRRKNAQ